MAVLLITYKLNNQNTNYSRFFEEIKGNSNRWWHYIEATWIVNTNLSVIEFSKRLRNHIYKNDLLLVVKIDAEHDGWLPAEAWTWLNNQNY